MTRRYMPALRGLFGDWAYYTCLMSLRDVAERVQFATEIHKNAALSDLMQRELKSGRAADIAQYLETQQERFFNSLVVAVYDGDPAWHELSDVKPQQHDIDVADISDDAIASIGFLSFAGGEKLFAVDGQHRLAGIQKAVKDDDRLGEDEVSVIFISHRRDAAGLMRTRRLFTTLNKTAEPVTKGETISLDEDDVMAITVRNLVENDRHFNNDRILVVGNSNLPQGDDKHLTTIVNLYDVLSILFSQVISITPIKKLQFNRPDDAKLAEFKEFALLYFDLLSASIPELKEYFSSKRPAAVVKKYRHSNGGSVLFRPVGLVIFAHLTAVLVKNRTLEAAIKIVTRLPTDLSKEPYDGLIWNSATGTMDLRRQALVRRLLLYMLGVSTRRSEVKLKADVARVTGRDLADVQLPQQVVSPRTRERSEPTA